LHGEVSRSLWKDVWSGVPTHEVPITSITNGVHTKTWMAPEFAALYRKHLGDWEEHLTDLIFGGASSTFLTRNCGTRINNSNAA
jgi:glucan phosphorylase